MSQKIDLRKEKRLRNEEYADRFKKPSPSRDQIKAAQAAKKARVKWCRVRGHSVLCEFNTCPTTNIGSTSKDIRKKPIYANS